VGAVGEALHFGLEGRAVARTRTHTLGARLVLGARGRHDERLRGRRGARGVTKDLLARGGPGLEPRTSGSACGSERKGLRRRIPRLLIQVGPCDGGAVESRRRAGLEAPLGVRRQMCGVHHEQTLRDGNDVAAYRTEQNVRDRLTERVTEV
jgi:hypothetical protein